jgi:hypothetical protein
VRPSLHALLAALGLASSFGALADKGGPGGGVSNGLGWGRGGSRFAEAPGAGPASAFEQRALLVKSGGLEFRASDNAGSRPAPRQDPGQHWSSPAQGRSFGTGGKVALAESDDAAALFAPWKVIDKDGKPVEKKAHPDCGAK